MQAGIDIRIVSLALSALFASVLASSAFADGEASRTTVPKPYRAQALTLRPPDPELEMMPKKFRSQLPQPEKVTYNERDVEAYQQHIQALIQGQRFDLLEQLFSEFALGETRTTDGRRMLPSFATAFGQYIQEPSDHDGAKLLAAWGDEYPDSVLRRLAAVALKMRVAWNARGYGYADKASPEGWAAYKQAMAEADALLDADKALWKTSPLWYVYKINVVAQTGTAAATDAVFSEATRQFPDYLPLYAARLNFLMPQWGGSYEKIDAFIRAATDALQAAEGRSTYARLYVSVEQDAPSQTKFFRDTLVTWPMLKTAFDDLIKRYPVTRNRNIYAGFACAARDRTTTAELLQALGNHALVWTSQLGITMESCRRFAFASA